jgi:DNA-binding protein H-NS
LARQKAVERLQEAANAESQEAERKRKEEEAQFNPIADLMS